MTSASILIIFNFQAKANSPKTSSRIPSNNVPTTIAITTEPDKNATKSYSSDLLGLSTPVNGPPDSNNASLDNDIFGFFMSAAPAVDNVQTNATPPAIDQTKTNTSESSLVQQEQDFFNQVGGAIDNDKGKMTKDSILALYGAAPTINRVPPANNQFLAQSIPTQLTDDFARLTTQFQSQPQQQPSAAFGTFINNGNNFETFGAMQPGQQGTLNFQPAINGTLASQNNGGFPNLPMPTGPTLFADFK